MGSPNVSKIHPLETKNVSTYFNIIRLVVRYSSKGRTNRPSVDHQMNKCQHSWSPAHGDLNLRSTYWREFINWSFAKRLPLCLVKIIKHKYNIYITLDSCSLHCHACEWVVNNELVWPPNLCWGCVRWMLVGQVTLYISFFSMQH